MQIKVGGNLDFTGRTHGQIGQQSTGQIECGGSGWEAGDLKQQIAHAFITQGDIGIHTAEIDCQSRNPCRTNSTADTGEVMHLNVVGVFGSDEIQVGRGAIQIPSGSINCRRAGIAAGIGRNG